MKELEKELDRKNIHWVTPETESIFADGQMEQIFDSLANVALKYKGQNFNMMPRLTNVALITGEVVEAVVNANFKCGDIEVLGIFIYDYTKISFNEVYGILQKHFKPQSHN